MANDRVKDWWRCPPAEDASIRDLFRFDEQLRDHRDDVQENARGAQAAEVKALRDVADLDDELSQIGHLRLPARFSEGRRVTRARTAAQASAAGWAQRRSYRNHELIEVDHELEVLDQRIRLHADTGDRVLSSRIASRARSFDGRIPAGLIEYPTAAEFAADDPRRATRAHDRTTEAENRTILAGSDWGYDWRLELDGRRSHYSTWRLSWLSTGEFYACCLRRDVRADASALSEQPVWLIASLTPSGESTSEIVSSDWLRELQRHRHERNSLLLAIEVIHHRYRPAER